MTELTNETKIIIEGKEFALIKYFQGVDDQWYCEELGIRIIRQEKLDKTISWQSMLARDLKSLIRWIEDEVNHWKDKVEKLQTNFPNLSKVGKDTSDEYYYYQAKLQRAENGLQELKKLSLSSIAKSNQK